MRKVVLYSLKDGSTQSCGCLLFKTHEFFDNIIGTKINRLTVLSLLSGNGYKAKYACICECGKLCPVPGSGLIRSSSKSCGCLQREVARKLGESFKGKLKLNRKSVNKVGVRDKTLVFRINKRIYQRDNYTCLKCKKRGGKLNGAHIRNFKDYIPGQYDENNILTLCVRCHKMYHKEYGLRYLGDYEMEEFLGYKPDFMNFIYDPIHLGI